MTPHFFPTLVTGDITSGEKTFAGLDGGFLVLRTPMT